MKSKDTIKLELLYEQINQKEFLLTDEEKKLFSEEAERYANAISDSVDDSRLRFGVHYTTSEFLKNLNKNADDSRPFEESVYDKYVTLDRIKNNVKIYRHWDTHQTVVRIEDYDRAIVAEIPIEDRKKLKEELEKMFKSTLQYWVDEFKDLAEGNDNLNAFVHLRKWLKDRNKKIEAQQIKQKLPELEGLI